MKDIFSSMVEANSRGLIRRGQVRGFILTPPIIISEIFMLGIEFLLKFVQSNQHSSLFSLSDFFLALVL